jgi:hypothetical protein
MVAGAGVGVGEGGAIVGLGVAGVSVGDGLGDDVRATVDGATEGDSVADRVVAVGEPETVGLGLVAGVAQATRTRIRSATTD